MTKERLEYPVGCHWSWHLALGTFSIAMPLPVLPLCTSSFAPSNIKRPWTSSSPHLVHSPRASCNTWRASRVLPFKHNQQHVDTQTQKHYCSVRGLFYHKIHESDMKKRGWTSHEVTLWWGTAIGDFCSQALEQSPATTEPQVSSDSLAGLDRSKSVSLLWQEGQNIP